MRVRERVHRRSGSLGRRDRSRGRDDRGGVAAIGTAAAIAVGQSGRVPRTLVVRVERGRVRQACWKGRIGSVRDGWRRGGGEDCSREEGILTWLSASDHEGVPIGRGSTCTGVKMLLLLMVHLHLHLHLLLLLLMGEPLSVLRVLRMRRTDHLLLSSVDESSSGRQLVNRTAAAVLADLADPAVVRVGVPVPGATDRHGVLW